MTGMKQLLPVWKEVCGVKIQVEEKGNGSAYTVGFLILSVGG